MHIPWKRFHWLRLKEEFCKVMCQGKAVNFGTQGWLQGRLLKS